MKVFTLIELIKLRVALTIETQTSPYWDGCWIGTCGKYGERESSRLEGCEDQLSALEKSLDLTADEKQQYADAHEGETKVFFSERDAWIEALQWAGQEAVEDLEEGTDAYEAAVHKFYADYETGPKHLILNEDDCRVRAFDTHNHIVWKRKSDARQAERAKKNAKCECGVGNDAPGHSDWCPKA